jgi:hypothetical protein
MAGALSDAQTQSADQRYRALLAVSEAIVSHRELSALFHEEEIRIVMEAGRLGVPDHDARPYRDDRREAQSCTQK